MEVPKNLRKVKPNEVVVFENEFDVSKGGAKMNAIVMTDSGDFVLFHTDHYWQDGEVKFYGE